MVILNFSYQITLPPKYYHRKKEKKNTASLQISHMSNGTKILPDKVKPTRETLTQLLQFNSCETRYLSYF